MSAARARATARPGSHVFRTARRARQLTFAKGKAWGRPVGRAAANSACPGEQCAFRALGVVPCLIFGVLDDGARRMLAFGLSDVKVG